MDDFNIDDILRKGSPKSGPKKARRNKKQEPTMGHQLVEVIEDLDKNMRELHRPMTGEEKRNAELLLDSMVDYMPDEDHQFVIDKIIDMLKMTMESLDNVEPDLSDMPDDLTSVDIYESQPDIQHFVFGLGMAYQHLKSQGKLS